MPHKAMGPLKPHLTVSTALASQLRHPPRLSTVEATAAESHWRVRDATAERGTAAKARWARARLTDFAMGIASVLCSVALAVWYRHCTRTSPCAMLAVNAVSPGVAPTPLPKTIAVVGGGLAGMSVAYHLLQLDPEVHVTVCDPCGPGECGGSAVAGGLLHPLTPNAKLIPFGAEGMEATLSMVRASQASLDEASQSDQVWLSRELLRAALSPKFVKKYQKAATRCLSSSGRVAPGCLPPAAYPFAPPPPPCGGVPNVALSWRQGWL